MIKIKEVFKKTYFFVAVFAIIVTNIAYAQETLKLNQKAPDFILKNIEGTKVIKSKDIFSEKKLTVLIFWDSYCPDCLKAIADCQRFFRYVQEQKLDVSVWSVNFDNEKLSKARSFIKGAGISFPVLSDPNGTTVNRYKAKAYDFSFFIIDSNGIIKHICYDHPPYVSDVIKEKVLKLLKERISLLSNAPNFSLKTLNTNELINSKVYFSKKDLTVMIFWNSQCKEALSAITKCQDLYKKIEKLGFGFLSVNFDSDTNKVKSSIKGKIDFHILSDTDKAVAKLYKVEDCCFSIFIVDNNGIIKYASYDIPTEINDIYEEVKKLGHKNESM